VDNAPAVLFLLRQGFAALSVDLPPAIADALDQVDRDLAGRAQLADVDRSELAVAVAAALAAGNDPSDAPDVRRLLVRAQLADLGLGQRLEALAEQRQADALVEHADAIIDALAAVVDDAHDRLTDARAVLPGAALDDPHLGSTLSHPDQLTAWANSRRALDRLATVTQTWVLLARATGAAAVHGTDRTAPLLLAALTVDQLDALPRTTLAPAVAGHDLELATFDTFAERVADLDHERQRRAAQQEAEGRRRAHYAATTGRA
jgi:hypothetical protein